MGILEKASFNLPVVKDHESARKVFDIFASMEDGLDAYFYGRGEYPEEIGMAFDLWMMKLLKESNFEIKSEEMDAENLNPNGALRAPEMNQAPPGTQN